MTDAQLWSWIVTIVGVIGWYFVGKKYWWSWFIGLACQVLWTVYAIVSNQPAFFVSVILYSFVYGKNAYSWTKEHFAKKKVKLEVKVDTDQFKAQPGVVTYKKQHVDSDNRLFKAPEGPVSQPFGEYRPVERLSFFTFEERQASPDFIPTEEKLWADAMERYGELRSILKTEHRRRVFDREIRIMVRDEYGFTTKAN